MDTGRPAAGGDEDAPSSRGAPGGDGPVERHGDPRFEDAAQRARLRRAAVVVSTVVLLAAAAAVGLLADLQRPPLPQDAFPTWRLVVGGLLAASGSLGLVLGGVAALRGDLVGAWSGSPLRTLSPPARQQLLCRIHGEEPTPPAGTAQARAAAAVGAQQRALLTLHGGLVLSLAAQAFLAASSAVVLVAGLGSLLLFRGLPLVVRSTARARRFLDEHPEPGAAGSGGGS